VTGTAPARSPTGTIVTAALASAIVVNLVSSSSSP
jgi:hypothetical protein